jgi:hypothetical protein
MKAMPLFATPAVPVNTMSSKIISVWEAIERDLDEAYLEMQEEVELQDIRNEYAIKASRECRACYVATH